MKLAARKGDIRECVSNCNFLEIEVARFRPTRTRAQTLLKIAEIRIISRSAQQPYQSSVPKDRRGYRSILPFRMRKHSKHSKHSKKKDPNQCAGGGEDSRR